MSPSSYDRVMVHYETANHLKLVDFTDSEVKAFILGVLVILSRSPRRGHLEIGLVACDARHIARQANVTVSVALSLLQKMNALGWTVASADGSLSFTRSGRRAVSEVARIPGFTVRRAIPAAIRRLVHDRCGGRCVGCGATSDLQVDHVVPWSLGGTDDPCNLQMLCGPCNRGKAASTGGGLR